LVDRVLDVEGPLAGALLAGVAPPSFAPPECALIFSVAYERLASYLAALGAPIVIGSPAHAADARHQARYLLDCLHPLALDRRVLPVTLAATALPPSDADLGPAHRLCVLLQPGAGARWKRWPLTRYLELAEALRARQLTVRWAAGPADADLRAALCASPTTAPELVPELDLQGFAAALARCALLVTPDTGVAHLAALLDVPQATLFGPTDPGRWRPLTRRARILRAPDRCGGRWLIPPSGDDALRRSLARCDPFDAHACRCLAALPVEPVLAACQSLLLSQRA
jgi:hypothetical protein